jgi:hypothetical protein
VILRPRRSAAATMNASAAGRMVSGTTSRIRCR